MYSLNCFQRFSQKSYFIYVCRSPISKSSHCAFTCLFTCSTIIHGFLQEAPYVITFLDDCVEIISLSQKIWVYLQCGTCISLRKWYQQFQAWSAKFLLSWLLLLRSQDLHFTAPLSPCPPTQISWDSRRQRLLELLKWGETIFSGE
jgi:hypothetical protein